MRVAAKNKAEYLAAAGDRAGDLKRLDKVIRKAAPNLEPYFMEGDTMTGFAYGKHLFKYANGREAVWPAVGVATQKHYISLYVSLVKGGKYLAELYARRLGKASCGKSCIRFRKLDDLDLEVVSELLEEAGRLAQDQRSFGA